MTSKRIEIKERPSLIGRVDKWIRAGESTAASARSHSANSARLTVDITPDLRGRIKVEAFRRGKTVAALVRGLLEREFATCSVAKGTDP